MRNTILLILFGLLIGGCDPQGDIRLIVTNSSQESKTIFTKIQLQADTFSLAPNDTVEIFSRFGIGGVMDDKSQIDLLEIFDTIYSNDSLLTSKIQLIENWKFNPVIVNKSRFFVSGGINQFMFNITDSTITRNIKTNPKILVLPPYDDIANRGISPDIKGYLEYELQ